VKQTDFYIETSVILAVIMVRKIKQVLSLKFYFYLFLLRYFLYHDMTAFYGTIKY